MKALFEEGSTIQADVEYPLHIATSIVYHLSPRTAKLSTRKIHEHDWRGEKYMQFMSWSDSNMQWIDLGVDFALQQNVMQQVLGNVKAPYRSWKTIRRNIQKYSSLPTDSYLCCQ